jgi:uncharacterized membrane protein YjjP (DUF1212 family)
MPVVAATLVSAIVFLLIKWVWSLDRLHVLIPPLVTYLAGAKLTLGMVELAYGDMVSGSSRLVTDFVQLWGDGVDGRIGPRLSSNPFLLAGVR